MANLLNTVSCVKKILRASKVEVSKGHDMKTRPFPALQKKGKKPIAENKWVFVHWLMGAVPKLCHF